MTKRHRLFVREYLRDLNATRAAKAVGYSEKTAGQIGQALLKKVEIAAAVQEGYSKREQALDLGLDRLFLELGRLALLDPAKFYDANGNLIPVPQLDEDSRRALAGMEIEEAYEHFAKGQAKPIGQIKKIKFADKGLNIERLLKYKHRLGDKLEVTGLEGLAERIQKARKKVS